MLIQLHGAEFHNRGAQLMLWTVIQEIGSRIPDVQFAMEPFRSKFTDRAKYGLLSLFPTVLPNRPRKARLVLRIEKPLSLLLPSIVADRYGIARRGDVDALVDISGYAFGDKWTSAPNHLFAKRIQLLKRANKPTILLPQMFGPFEKKDIADSFRPVVANSDLIFARDQLSFDCLMKINSSNRQIGLAPDITIFSEKVVPTDIPEKPYACLVPNARMLDKGSKTWEGGYLNGLAKAGHTLAKSGVKPYVVVHEDGQQDLDLAHRLAQMLSLPDEQCYVADDPLEIKGFISQAKLLIGSRFHAIVSALSSEVPVICLGWAHKYDALMTDFGVEDFLCRHEYGADRLSKMVETLLGSRHQQVCETLSKKRKEISHSNQQMWESVIGCLNRADH